MLFLLVVAVKILAVKAGISIHLACWPYQPISPVRARYLCSCFVEVDYVQTNMPGAKVVLSKVGHLAHVH